MKRHLQQLTGLLAAMILTACAPAVSSEMTGMEASNARVIESEDLGDRGYLSDALNGRVVNMRVDQQGTCPEISIRGRQSNTGTTNPKVYVDGTAATNTCVLNGIPTANVQRVEVYPTGHTSRAGYAPHAHGLILVFTQRA